MAAGAARHAEERPGSGTVVEQPALKSPHGHFTARFHSMGGTLS